MTRAGAFWGTVGWRMLGRGLLLGAGTGVLVGGFTSLILFAWWAGPWVLGIGLVGGLALGLLLGLLNGLVLGALTCRFFFPPRDRPRYRRAAGVVSVLVSVVGTLGLYRLGRTPDFSFYEAVVGCALPFVGFAAWWASGRGADWYCDQYFESGETVPGKNAEE